MKNLIGTQSHSVYISNHTVEFSSRGHFILYAQLNSIGWINFNVFVNKKRQSKDKKVLLRFPRIGKYL